MDVWNYTTASQILESAIRLHRTVSLISQDVYLDRPHCPPNWDRRLQLSTISQTGICTMRFVICRIEIDSVPATGEDNLHAQVIGTVFVGDISCRSTGLRVIDTGPGNRATLQSPLIGSIIRTSRQHSKSLRERNERDMWVVSSE
jgi:hypothetical protein